MGRGCLVDGKPSWMPIGYVPNIMQSESTLQGILVVSTLLPVVLMAFQLILQMILRRYRGVF